jgi:hypothetical protein
MTDVIKKAFRNEVWSFFQKIMHLFDGLGISRQNKPLAYPNFGL